MSPVILRVDVNGGHPTDMGGAYLLKLAVNITKKYDEMSSVHTS